MNQLPDDSVVPLVPPAAAGSLAAMPPAERRVLRERRQRVWRSIWYGAFRPRRRLPPRRDVETRFHGLDWHGAHLLAVSMGILLLSVADAFMTLRLLADGAVEINPVMAAVVYRSAGLFAALKMGMTGVGVVLMVFLAPYRLMRVVRVDAVLYAVFMTYLALLAYEYWMLRELVDLPPY